MMIHIGLKVNNESAGSLLEFFRLVFVGGLGIVGISIIILASKTREVKLNRAGVILGLGTFATNAMSGHPGQALLGLTAATCFAIVVVIEAAKKLQADAYLDSDTAKSNATSFLRRVFWN